MVCFVAQGLADVEDKPIRRFHVFDELDSRGCLRKAPTKEAWRILRDLVTWPAPAAL